MLRDSVTLWLRAAENHDEAAAQALFDRYFDRVQALARRKLAKSSRRVVDEEDIAITTFHACLDRVRSNRFPPLKDRNELWRLLVKITDRKACDVLRKHLSAKRGAGRVRGESVFFFSGSEQSVTGIGRVADQGARHSLAVQFADEYRKLMALLSDDGLREVARLIISGFSTSEIAKETNRTQRTVQRRLRMILDVWNQASQEASQ
jgi:DNA-directed RNA polymerase specialized sigma24 family protein